MMTSYRVAVAISIQPIVANGDDIIIVFFLPTYCSRNPARILPQNAPLGGIEPARKSTTFYELRVLTTRISCAFRCIYYLPMMQYLSLAIDLDRIRESMEWLVPNSPGPIQCKKMTLTCIVRVQPIDANRGNDIILFNC